MIRIFLRALNPALLLLGLLVLIALQTALFQSPPASYLKPDVVLIAVIWFALRREFIEGGILTLLLAEFAEIHSTSPQGVLMIGAMAIYLALQLARRILVIPRFSSLLFLTLWVALAWRGVNLMVLSFLGLAGQQWLHTLSLALPGAASTCLVAWLLFRGLARFDWITYKDERAWQQLDDELRLEWDIW